MIRPEDLFDLSKTPYADLFDGCGWVWEALGRLGAYIRGRVRPGIEGRVMAGATIEGEVFVGKGAVVEPGAYVRGPAILGRDCQVRKGAYLRGAVLAGDGSILGNSCEFKNVALLAEGIVPHLSYVGDSILGHRAHLGAGVIVSNAKLVKETVRVTVDGRTHDTGLRKFGAIVGDGCDVGCGTVLNPGTILGKRCLLYPLLSFRGVLPADRIVKLRQTHTATERRVPP